MKKIVLGTTLAASCLVAYAGASYVGGNVAADKITELSQKPLHRLIKFAEADHKKGWFTSSGSIRLSVANPDPDATEADRIELPATLNYTINHSPTLQGLASYEMILTVDGKPGEVVRQASGSDHVLKVDGQQSFGGAWDYQFSTPQFDINQDEATIKIPASAGTARVSGQALKLDWLLDSLMVEADSGVLSMKSLRLAADMNDMTLGLGSSTVSVDSVEAGPVQVSGIKIQSDATRQGDLLDSVVTPSIKSLEIPGQKLTDLSARLEMSGLNANAVDTVNHFSRHVDPMTATDSELVEFEKAILQLLDGGMRFAITAVTVNSDQGSLNANLEISLSDASANPEQPLLQRLSASTSFNSKGNLLPPQQQAMLMGSGFAISQANGLSASASLQQGELRINGQPDQQGLAGFLAMATMPAEQMLGQWRSSLASGKPTLRNALNMNQRQVGTR